MEKWDTLFYDSLIKVPLIMRYPGLIEPGATVETFVENIDIMPTILELCGLEVPQWVQGRSLVQAIADPEYIHREAVFAEGGLEMKAIAGAEPMPPESDGRTALYYYKHQTMIDYPESMHRAKMIRTKRWKFIFRVNGERELYDLETDPHELHNVADRQEYQVLMQQLMEQLLIWAIRTETDYPELT